MLYDLSYCAQEVRRQDWERFLCALFAPADRREAMFALLAFNQEIAKTREIVSEPLLGEIRLQWWRDALDKIYGEGACASDRVTGHQVLDVLASAIQHHHLNREHFDALLDGRARELSSKPLADTEELAAYARATSGRLNMLMLEVLASEGQDSASEAFRQLNAAASDLGVGWAIVGQIRALSARMPGGPSLLPADKLIAAGLDPAGGWGAEAGAALAGPVAELAEVAANYVTKARAARSYVKRRQLSVMLPAVLVDQYLKRLRRAGHNPFRAGIESSRPALQFKVGISALREVY